jgi:DNA helicase-2/ATP-dependent DNA helicase PcrA
MTFEQLKDNKTTANIRDIEIKSRRAQYTYLAKVAANCKEETAVLFKDSESVIPLVDIFEKQESDYRLVDVDVKFFSSKVVRDISNIIKFAYNPSDIELFMRIYHKIYIGMTKDIAVEACRNSKEMKIPVIDAAIEYGRLEPTILKRTKTIQKHLKELLEDPADRAVYRIVKYMGYGAYLDKMGINDSNIQILDAIGFNETTPLRLVERLGELAQIISEKKSDTECNMILSTIASSADVEYETVYIMDARDGILPLHPVYEKDKATSVELASFEADMQLYLTAVTRAKTHLNIFSFKHHSIFTDMLLGKSNKPEIRSHARKNLLLSKSAQSQVVSKKTVVESEYQDKLEEIKSSGHVKHKTYGDGKVIAFNGDTLEIAFPSKTAKCKLKFMMENGLIL